MVKLPHEKSKLFLFKNPGNDNSNKIDITDNSNNENNYY